MRKDLNNLNPYFKKLEKEEGGNLKASLKNEHWRAEINEIENNRENQWSKKLLLWGKKKNQ